MKKHIKNSALLLCIVSGLIIIINKLISVFSHMTDYLPSGGKYYHWKYGNIYYTKSGKGKPVLLIHDLDPTASSYEWKAVTKKLAENHTVYAIDLLGCGRSEKPNMTYTNYLYVQLMNEFISNVINEKTDVIDALIEVYNSFISPKIDDYNSSVYYENPNYIFECYKAKKML